MEKMFTMANKNAEMKEELSEKMGRLNTHVTTEKFKMILLWGMLCFLAGYLFAGVINQP
jgi:hypothetical protein